MDDKKTVWVKPDRRMTMDELWARFTYDPDYETGDLAYDGALYDRYDNPTYGTLCTWYERDHNIYEGPYTLEEFDELLDEWRKEADDEDSSIPLVV